MTLAQEVLLVLLVVLVIILVFMALWFRGRHRRAFARLYPDVSLPAAAKVARQHRRHRGDSGFVLEYPGWMHPKKDGTRDARRAQNSVLRPVSRLRDGDLEIMLPDPFAMYAFVQQLRQAGYDVPMCAEELERNRESAARSARHLGRTAGGVSAPGPLSFAGSPADFERFCAELFEDEGCRAELTGAGADGGVDIRLFIGTELAVVECKLYAPGNTVGRPLLQKLVGAQQHERADHAVFVTTSSFTRPAIEYATAMGIRLVDGTALAEMLARSADVPVKSAESVLLTESDIWEGYPSDLRPQSSSVSLQGLRPTLLARSSRPGSRRGSGVQVSVSKRNGVTLSKRFGPVRVNSKGRVTWRL